MKTLLVLIVLVVSGCATMNAAERSAGYIGCPPDEIQIENSRTPLMSGTGSWVAACRGKRFICSSNASAGYSFTTKCTEEIGVKP